MFSFGLCRALLQIYTALLRICRALLRRCASARHVGICCLYVQGFCENMQGTFVHFPFYAVWRYQQRHDIRYPQKNSLHLRERALYLRKTYLHGRKIALQIRKESRKKTNCVSGVRTCDTHPHAHTHTHM